MEAFNLKECGDTLTAEIKSASWFPVRTGNLRDNATTGQMMPFGSEEVYRIRFDESMAPYIKYLEEGITKTTASLSKPGTGIKGFGTPFNYSGVASVSVSQFKTGKHMGFISDKTIHYIIDYICNKYNGELR